MHHPRSNTQLFASSIRITKTVSELGLSLGFGIELGCLQQHPYTRRKQHCIHCCQISWLPLPPKSNPDAPTATNWHSKRIAKSHINCRSGCTGSLPFWDLLSSLMAGEPSECAPPPLHGASLYYSSLDMQGGYRPCISWRELIL